MLGATVDAMPAADLILLPAGAADAAPAVVDIPMLTRLVLRWQDRLPLRCRCPLLALDWNTTVVVHIRGNSPIPHLRERRRTPVS